MSTHILTDIEPLSLLPSSLLRNEPPRHLLDVHRLPRQTCHDDRLIDDLERCMRVVRTEREGLADPMGGVSGVIMSGRVGARGGKSGKKGEEGQKRCGAHGGCK